MGTDNQLVLTASSDDAIEAKIKELTALAISIASRCEDCIAHHCRAAIGHGATQADVTETIGVAVEMGGGPPAVYGARAYQVYKDLAGQGRK